MERRTRCSKTQLGVGTKGSACGSWAGLSLPGWVARATVGADQTSASEMNTNQEIPRGKALPPLAYWLSFTCSSSYSFQPNYTKSLTHSRGLMSVC